MTHSHMSAPNHTAKARAKAEAPAFRVALANYILRHDISQREAGRRLSVSAPTVNLWLRSKQNPAPLTIRALRAELSK